ncbi:MAG: methyltransferase domain-containing protein [Candidatus Bathyarchaeia archaeon]
MTDFSKIASHYEKTSIVQRSASNELFDLIKITETDDVLDLGCGTGELTKKIREITKGKVIGIDSANGMIEIARQTYSQCNISFEICSAENLNYNEQFDVIFCNSTFQWFKNPVTVLRNCYRALRKNGRMSVQAPARKIYSPNFVKEVDCVNTDPRTKEIFSRFNSPWFFLETAEDYRNLFENLGFEVLYSRIDEVITSHTPDEVFNIFNSGASAGYLNQQYYDVSLIEEYIETFKKIVKDSFIRQANSNGEVDLVFFRIYLLAKKC